MFTNLKHFDINNRVMDTDFKDEPVIPQNYNPVTGNTHDGFFGTLIISDNEEEIEKESESEGEAIWWEHEESEEEDIESRGKELFGWDFLMWKPLEEDSEESEEESESESESEEPWPNICMIPLKENETESWLQLKNFYDKGVDKPYKIWAQVNIKHPFVTVIGSFAVNGFNESYGMYVDKGNHNRLSEPAFRMCKFIRDYEYYEYVDKGNHNCLSDPVFRMCKLVKNYNYEFVLTIEAIEDGSVGTYNAKVECKNCELTLMHFCINENMSLFLETLTSK